MFRQSMYFPFLICRFYERVSDYFCLHQGVTEPVSQPALQQTLTQRFGPIKELEIVRSKACAFLEFANVDSARRAIIASLSHNQGGEGGVWVDGGEAGQVRISVETKKERGERPGNVRGRGAAPGQGGEGGRGQGQAQGGEGGRGQGSFRGRGAGRGRGGAQPK